MMAEKIKLPSYITVMISFWNISVMVYRYTLLISDKGYIYIHMC